MWSPIGSYSFRLGWTGGCTIEVGMYICETRQMSIHRLDQGDHFRQVTILGRWLFIQVPLYYTGDHPREVAVHTGPTVLYR